MWLGEVSSHGSCEDLSGGVRSHLVSEDIARLLNVLPCVGNLGPQTAGEMWVGS